jgi:hypothetical protein
MNTIVERAGILLALLDFELEVDALRVAMDSNDPQKIREAANKLVMMVSAFGFEQLTYHAPHLLERIGVRVLEANCKLVAIRTSQLN